MPFRRGLTFWTWLRLRNGRRVRRSLCTRERVTAREIQRMLDCLHERRDWELLEAAAFGSLTVGDLFDRWRQGDEALRDLRARLNDVDLVTYVESWAAWAQRRAGAATVEKYRKQLRVLVPEDVPLRRSEFTRRRVAERLAQLDCSGSTARRYCAAWSSFASYLVDLEVLDANPLRSIRLPRNNPPRQLWFALSDVVRLVDGQPEPFRALAALREGAGVEISAALAVRRGDVDLAGSTVLVRGTKTPSRTRVARVEPWAMKRLRQYLRRVPLTPAARLFEPVTYGQVREEHRKALAALGLDQRYRLHDCRHSYAVRQMQAGVDPQLIAHNLGHQDAFMVLKVYGKYRPTPQDLARAQAKGMR